MISVVIPVRNGGSDLVRCLSAVARQRVDDDVEVVVVDSSSTDGSADVALSFGARVCVIDRSEFGHGRTRNLGASLSEGDVLVFTSQDAYAASEDWLARLARPLGTPGRAGVYGRQLPHAHARPPERYFLNFLYGPVARVQHLEPGEDASFEHTLFSNVNAAIPRPVWQELPFAEDLVMSEDQDWSLRALRAGYELVYEPQAAVYHSHRYSVKSAFRRFFDSGASATTSYAPGRDGAGALRRAGVRYARGEVEWLWTSGQRRWIPYAVVYELAKFAGLQIGRRHEHLPAALKRTLSATPGFWER